MLGPLVGLEPADAGALVPATGCSGARPGRARDPWPLRGGRDLVDVEAHHHLPHQAGTIGGGAPGSRSMLFIATSPVRRGDDRRARAASALIERKLRTNAYPLRRQPVSISCTARASRSSICLRISISDISGGRSARSLSKTSSSPGMDEIPPSPPHGRRRRRPRRTCRASRPPRGRPACRGARAP